VSQTGYGGDRERADEAFYRLGVGGGDRALLGERERLARQLVERRRRRLVAAAANRLAACPDLTR
jgi:hypothetical protein